MKRKDALTAIMAATARGDTRTALRIYIEHRSVSFQAYQKAVAEGNRRVTPQEQRRVGYFSKGARFTSK